MPQVNLSTMSGPALRQLLDSTRQRGEAALSYQILQEMAARREAGGRRGLFHMRRPAEGRIVAVDHGDPMEPDDDLPPMPAWRAPLPQSEPAVSPSPLSEPEPAAGPLPPRPRRRKTQPAPPAARARAAPAAVVDVEPAPPPPLEPKPASVVEADPEPPELETANARDEGLRLPPQGLESLGALRRGPAVAFAVGAVAAFAIGAAVGVTLGWRVGAVNRQAPSAAARPAAPIRTAALVRLPAPAPAPAPAASLAATPEPAAEAPPEPAAQAPADPAAAQPPDLHESPSSTPPEAAEAAPEGTGVAMELPAPPPHRGAVKTAQTPPAANACAAQPTPADREICGDPQLRRLQRELRQAYAQALEAHQDRALLRQRQLAWRSERDGVSDPTRLARLYEQRIHKLNAATAEARRQR